MLDCIRSIKTETSTKSKTVYQILTERHKKITRDNVEYIQTEDGLTEIWNSNYGGVLTFLEDLPLGVTFEVTNGNWT